MEIYGEFTDFSQRIYFTLTAMFFMSAVEVTGHLDDDDAYLKKQSGKTDTVCTGEMSSRSC